MRILAVESSACTASVAVVHDGRLISEFFTNSGLTHSQTLMPMVNAALSCAKIDVSSIDAFAAAIGPGSYTGIRIGVAAVKGLSQALNKPCIGISTLEAMPHNLSGNTCIACAVMDARCGQVYTALFECRKNTVKRITADAAMTVYDLKLLLESTATDLPVVLIGDGAELCYKEFESKLKVELSSEFMRFQRAAGIAAAAAEINYDLSKHSANNLIPLYLRAPQAERNLRNGKEG